MERLERVARALCKQAGDNPDAENENPPLSQLTAVQQAMKEGRVLNPMWREYLRAAQSYIEVWDAAAI